MADAVFNEVLQVSIDTTTFVAGLQALEDAYDAFVTRVNDKGFGAGNVISLGGFESLNSSITALQDHLDAFDAEVTSSLQAVDEQFAKMGASASAASQASVNAAAQAAQAQANGAPGGASPAAAVAAAQATAQAAQQTQASVGAAGASLGGVNTAIIGANGGMLGLFGTVLKFNLAWKAAGLVIEGVLAILKSPLTLFEDGSKYLSQLQDSAAQLQGPIAATVKFSSDLAQNFKLSGQAASSVVEELQKMSIAMGVPVQNLENVFKNVLESGGQNFVKNLQGAVNLTQEFALAMTVAGGSVDNARKLLSEIPQLLSGTETGTNRVLKVLNMTTEQWEEMRQKALANQNLDEVLADKLAPYLTVLDQANLRQSVLNENIKLQATRIEAAIALPLWQSWIGVLQNVSTFLKNNGDELVLIGSEVLDVAVSFGKLVVQIAELVTGTNSLHAAGSQINGMFQSILFVVRSVIEMLRGLVQELNVFGQIPADKMFNKDAWIQANAQVEAISKESMDKVTQYAVDAANAINGVKGTSFSLGGDPSLLNSGSAKTAIIDPKAASEASDAFRKLQQDFRNELDETKKAYANTQDDINNFQKEGTISAQEAAKSRINAFKLENDTIQSLVTKYKELSDASTGVKKSQITTADEAFTRVSQDSDAATDKGVDDAQAKLNEETEAAQKQHNAAMLALAKQYDSELLADIKKQVADGLLTKVEGFDAEAAVARSAYSAEIKAADAEFTAAGANMAKQSQALDKMTAADQRYTAQTINNSRERAALVVQEQAQSVRAANQLQLTEAQTGQIIVEANKVSGESYQEILEAQRNVAAANLRLAESDLAAAQAALENARATGIKGDALDKLVQQEADAEKAVATASAQSNKAGLDPDTVNALRAIFGSFGDDVTNLGNIIKGNFHDDVEGMASAIKSFAGAANSIISGVKSGGALGGIGAGLSAAGGLAPGPWGAALSAAGSVISLISGLFTAAAQAEAKKIQTQVDKINEEYSTGQTNLIQTLNAIEAERADAITSLSGMKGGKQELKDLLPQLDSQIDSLKNQQTQIFTSFNNSLAVLKLQSSTLGDMLSTYQQLNQQVTEFVGAGGDAATAAQFMSLSLLQQKQTTQDSLNQGELQAISDAQSLNQLLQQQVDLEKQYAEQEFALRNSDALERAASPAVNAAIAYQQQKATNDAALTALTQQITYTTQRVDLEKQVFTIATDTATLQSQANALNLQSLQEQVQQWRDMQTIINSIVTGANGLTTLNQTALNNGGHTPQPPGGVNNTPIQVQNLNVTLPNVTDASSFQNELSNELRIRGRFGNGTQFS